MANVTLIKLHYLQKLIADTLTVKNLKDNIYLNFIKMKELKNLRGAKTLSKNEQRNIKGGTRQCAHGPQPCPPNYMCVDGECVLAP